MHIDEVHDLTFDIEPDAGTTGEFVLPPVVRFSVARHPGGTGPSFNGREADSERLLILAGQRQ